MQLQQPVVDVSGLLGGGHGDDSVRVSTGTRGGRGTRGGGGGGGVVRGNDLLDKVPEVALLDPQAGLHRVGGVKHHHTVVPPCEFGPRDLIRRVG